MSDETQGARGRIPGSRWMEALILADAEVFADVKRRLAKYSKPDASGCLLWTRAVNSRGYGQLGVLKRSMSTHRLAWLIANRALPAAMLACHRCDVPRCINPEHLFLGTHADNSADKVAKGRHLAGALAAGAKLSDAAVERIRARCAAGESRASVARAFDLSAPYVSQLVLGQYRVASIGGAR